MKKNHTQVQPSTNKKKGNIKKNDEVNIISLIDYPNFSKKIYIVDVANVCGAQVAKKKKFPWKFLEKLLKL